MPKFDSPIGSKQFRGQPMRDISVPDESSLGSAPLPPRRHVQDQSVPAFDERALHEFQSQMQQPMPDHIREMSDVERQILAAKKAKREGKERLSEGARRRIEMLLGMTRLTREVEIAGQIFKLQTSNMNQNKHQFVGLFIQQQQRAILGPKYPHRIVEDLIQQIKQIFL